MKHQHQTYRTEVQSNQCYKLWARHILMTVRGKSGNSGLLLVREREVSSSIAVEIVMGGWEASMIQAEDIGYSEPFPWPSPLLCSAHNG